MRLAEKVCKALAVAGTHTPADVEARIASGHMQHFEDGETVVVTTINQYPQDRWCEVFMVAGDLETAWKIEREQIEPFAREQGCSRIVGRGRKGWAKSAREHGYTRQWVMAERKL